MQLRRRNCGCCCASGGCCVCSDVCACQCSGLLQCYLGSGWGSLCGCMLGGSLQGVCFINDAKEIVSAEGSGAPGAGGGGARRCVIAASMVVAVRIAMACCNVTWAARALAAESAE